MQFQYMTINLGYKVFISNKRKQYFRPDRWEKLSQQIMPKNPSVGFTLWKHKSLLVKIETVNFLKIAAND